MSSTLLPQHATAPLEKRLSLTFADISNIPVPINLLWSAKHCPVKLLPWLAWSLSVDEWDEEWGEDLKRQTILNAAYIHRHKGTIAAIRRVMRTAGFGEVKIIENQNLRTWDGSLTFDGLELYDNDNMHWAQYKIMLQTPITVQEAAQVRRLLNENAPARCHLLAFVFEQASHRWNGEISFDGNYTFGEVE